MEHSNNPLWYEDLETHRQPALYYLSSRDTPTGPHLICDWNGPPTNYDEFNIDIISNIVNSQKAQSDTEDSKEQAQTHSSSSSNSGRMTQTCNQTVLISEDANRFDFLTVPPLVRGIVLRALKVQKIKRPEPPRETEDNSIKRDPRENGTTTHKRRGPSVINHTIHEAPYKL